jgi:hypothetical protein
MRILVGIIFQILQLSFASGAAFMLSNIIAPLKPVISHPATHLPRMNIRFNDFTLPLAALEDDYYVGDVDEETIPQNIPAQELRAGTVEMKIKQTVLRIPSMKMEPAKFLDMTSFTVPTAEIAQDVESSKLTLPPPAPSLGLHHPHHWLEGKIEFVDGLALTNSTDEIHIGWFVDGSQKREGRVFIREGTYSLKVDQLEGEVIAELVDSSGFVLGEAVLDLEKVARERGTSLLTIADVDLKLSPYNFGFKAQTISVYDTPSSRVPIPGTEIHTGYHDTTFHTDQKGSVYQESVSAKSTAMLFAGKGGHRETIVLADFAREQKLRMFPEKYVTALFDTIDLPKEFRDQGVIWGIVKSVGAPSAGYKVRMANHPEVSPIYFNMYIPDEKSTQTSTDGQYAFVGLIEGQYELEVLDATDAIVETKLVYVKPAAVATLDFELGRTKTLYIKYFDPFKTQAQPVEFVSLGNKSPVSGMTENSFPVVAHHGTDPLLLFARTENSKVDSATFASRARKYQELPVLDHSWFSEIQRVHKIDKSRGVIVGFLDTEETFNVYLDESIRDFKTLYFDVHGKIISPKDQGRRKAGVIFYDTGTGLHTVLIESATGQILSELAYVDGDAVALFYKPL